MIRTACGEAGSALAVHAPERLRLDQRSRAQSESQTPDRARGETKAGETDVLCFLCVEGRGRDGTDGRRGGAILRYGYKSGHDMYGTAVEQYIHDT